MQSWISHKSTQGVCPETAQFFSTPVGAALLQRIVMAEFQTTHFGCGGIRAIQEFLQLSTLSNFVASSEGALQAFSERYDQHIIDFAAKEEARLATNLKRKKITAGLDELFRGRHPCLVAIEVVSDFILLEKFTDDRTADTWSKELKPRIDGLNLELGQVVSDLCGGIRACTDNLGATHIPELFHAQQELTKATAAALASQERQFVNELADAERKLEKAVAKHGQDSQMAQEATIVRNCRRHGLECRTERRKKVQAAKKELGRIHHPIDLKFGKLQTVEVIAKGFKTQLEIVETCAKEASLSKSSMNRLQKAGRAFDAIVVYVTSFFAVYWAFVTDLKLLKEQELLFNEVLFPLSYLTMMWRRLPKKMREELTPLKTSLEARLKEASYSEAQKNEWMLKSKELAEIYQRSSSCVEGRNGMLSLYYHRFHRLNVRGLKALTVVHNFHTRRADGTTAAERLFNSKHEDLFESLVANVSIPGRPRQQHHDLQKRQLGRQNRLVA